jgi:hypothetical protein
VFEEIIDLFVVAETVHIQLDLGDGHEDLSRGHGFRGVLLVKTYFVDSDQMVRVEFEHC